MKTAFEKYKYLFVTISFILLVSFLFKNQDSILTFWSGLFIGLVIAELIRSREEGNASILRVNKDNVEEFLNDLQDRLNLADQFILDSHDLKLRKEWDQMRMGEKGDKPI